MIMDPFLLGVHRRPNARSGLHKMTSSLEAAPTIFSSKKVALELPVAMKLTETATTLSGIEKGSYFLGNTVHTEHVSPTAAFRREALFAGHATKDLLRKEVNVSGRLLNKAVMLMQGFQNAAMK